MSDGRTVLDIGGSDRVKFLQDLVTNDISGADQGLVYAALLTPQGKFIADFFVLAEADRLLLDVDAALAPSLFQRLSLYRLRADVTIEDSGLNVHRGTGEAPQDGHSDPRHPDLGWRAYRDTPQGGDTTDWTALRVAHGVPASGAELTPDTYILEAGFERLNGVDFRKGCYVGQEIVARMKHKTELRKGLVRVAVDGAAPVGTPITRDGKPVGTLYSQANGEGLAHLRHDRAGDDMIAGEARVSLID